jgi:hypothetical protein
MVLLDAIINVTARGLRVEKNQLYRPNLSYDCLGQMQIGHRAPSKRQ